MEICIGPGRKGAVVVHGVHAKRIVLERENYSGKRRAFIQLTYLHRVLQEHTDKTINLLLLRCFETMTDLIDRRFHAEN